jgi:hypothetical protein
MMDHVHTGNEREAKDMTDYATVAARYIEAWNENDDAARQKLKTYQFKKPWMHMMAMGITEQTYDSRSRVKPEVIRQSFYQDCLRYKLARK